MTLTENYEKIEDKIAEVCTRIGKPLEYITVVAATKTVSADIIAELPRIGIAIAGENRAQELNEKFFTANDLEWHFVGALQTNKVKSIIKKVSVIQSVDRKNLAEEIDRQSALCGKITDIFIEVNAGKETSKSGVDLDDFQQLVSYVYTLKNIRLTGLMSVMPKDADKRPYLFMNELFTDLKAKDGNVKYLSMGMSGDYLTAIECGANMIRLGRILFGERQ